MSYLIVPSRVTTDSALVWIGAIDEAAQPRLFADGVEQQLTGWAELRGGPHRLAHARVQVTGLTPRTRCALELRIGERVVAVGSVTPLPLSLPTESEGPFTALLGSCFDVAHDRGVAKTYARLRPGPDIKILCGDQVYLDAPWSHFLIHTHDRAEMERMFFESYQRTWESADLSFGLGLLLRDGANYLSSDDHEFWNNAPNRGTYVRDSWKKRGRDDWTAVASSLFNAFQDDQRIEQFSIGPLSFLLADTRFHRDADENLFMRPADLDQLRSWVTNLQGPGVLVVGQPIFTDKVGVTGHFADWSLANYQQYHALVIALQSSRHTIVVLTGDVHFGRVAYCELPSRVNGPAPRLIEIVASPLALVDSKAGGDWSRGPDRFPADNMPGTVGLPITTIPTYTMTQDHFLTLEFTGVAGGAGLRVRSWPIVPGANDSFGPTVFEETLY